MKKTAGVVFLIIGFIGSIAASWFAYFWVGDNYSKFWLVQVIGAICVWAVTITIVGYLGRIFDIDVFKKSDNKKE